MIWKKNRNQNFKTQKTKKTKFWVLKFWFLFIFIFFILKKIFHTHTHIGWHVVIGTLGIESQQPYRFSFTDLRTYGQQKWTWADSFALNMAVPSGFSRGVRAHKLMEESEIPYFATTTFAILVNGQTARLDENSGTKDPDEMKVAILIKCCNGKLYLLHLVIQVVGCHWYCVWCCTKCHRGYRLWLVLWVRSLWVSLVPFDFVLWKTCHPSTHCVPCHLLLVSDRGSRFLGNIVF